MNRKPQFLLACFILVQSVASNAQPQSGHRSYDCLIEPSISVELGSSIRGVADEVLVKRGGTVKKGDTLVRLESDVQRAAVALAKARSENTAELASRKESMNLANTIRARMENLYEDKNVSRQVLEEAQSQAVIAESDWDRARENDLLAELELKQAAEILSLRTIRSPISGIVVERMISPGELVTEDQPILSLVSIDPLYVEVIIPAEEFNLVRPGSIATVLPSEPIGGRYVGEVTIVDSVIDAASGTYGIRVELPNPDRTLPAGLGCMVEFDDPQL